MEKIWTSFHRSVRWCHQRDTCKMAWRALSVGGGCTTDGIVMRLNGLPDVPHGSDPDYGPYQYWYRGSWAMSNLAMGSAFFCIQGVVISFHRKITAGSLQTFHEGKSVTSSDQARESIFRVVWKWGTPMPSMGYSMLFIISPEKNRLQFGGIPMPVFYQE